MSIVSCQGTNELLDCFFPPRRNFCMASITYDVITSFSQMMSHSIWWSQDLKVLMVCVVSERYA